MPIKQSKYRKKKNNGPVLVNIRLRWRGPGRKTAGEAREALRSILHSHEVPKGWQFAAINWGHPRTHEALDSARQRLQASDGWTEGNIDDLFEKFEGLIEALEGRIQVGVVK